jgi:hypothetical protein
MGFGAAALFTGGGWVVCLIAGATAGALSWIAEDKIMNPFGQKHIEPLIEKMRMSV